MYNTLNYNKTTYNSTGAPPAQVSAIAGVTQGAGIATLSLVRAQIIFLSTLGVGGASLRLYSPSSQGASQVGWRTTAPRSAEWIKENPTVLSGWVPPASAAGDWIKQNPRTVDPWTDQPVPTIRVIPSSQGASQVGWRTTAPRSAEWIKENPTVLSGWVPPASAAGDWIKQNPRTVDPWTDQPVPTNSMWD